MEIQEQYMQRCLQLAKLGKGYVAPNPLVGAVLVYQDKIIGEGYHQQYGHAHAEVNCLNSVSPDNKKYLTQSTLYVNLEPCVHHGKTPPCTDLIIAEKIPQVVIGCEDAFALVAGKGIQRLKETGVQVTCGILEEEAKKLNERFFTFHKQLRPFIILKWAQTADGYIANLDKSPLKISNIFTDKLVHQWRSEEMAIMIGANTAISDNPSLTNRYWSGHHPVRILLDPNLRVPETSKIFDASARIIVFNLLRESTSGHIIHMKYDKNKPVISQVLSLLHHQNIQSVIIEGGARLLQSFIEEDCWDEARIITSDQYLYKGIPAPKLHRGTLISSIKVEEDKIDFFR